jgi:hypothetical protein
MAGIIGLSPNNEKRGSYTDVADADDSEDILGEIFGNKT